MARTGTIRTGDEPIPGYRIEGLLGRGQFGEVWRARSPGNTAVALKVLELTGSHGWKEFRAIQRVKEIRHAHLMPIVAIWLLDDDGRVLGDDAIASIAHSQAARETLVSDAETLVALPPEPSDQPARLIVATLLADGSLGDRLKACQAAGEIGIPVDELLGCMAEAAKGLDFLNAPQHKIGDSFGAVQHCDVKPDNIMLSGGSVVIADFGVAQTLAHARFNATATSLGGTPAYMAPELFLNKPSSASDQYSLAVTYYELRTGDLPFREQTYAAVYQAHREGTLDFSGCKPAEQAVLRRATATKPEERFPSCAAFVEALRESLRPPTTSAAPARPAKSAGGLVWGAAALLLALFAGGGYIAFRSWPRLPAKPPLGRVVLLVDPPDAKVTVDGQAVVANPAGEFLFEGEPGREYAVRASLPPDWVDAELAIKPQAQEQRQAFRLEHSAEYFANEAYGLVADGAVTDEAVTALAAAIKQTPGTYARLPDPVVAIAGSRAITALRITESGRRLAAASSDGAIRSWTIDGDAIDRSGASVARTGGEVELLAATDEWIAAIAVTDEREIIVATGPDGRTHELTVPDVTGLKQVAITGDGRTLVAAAELLELLPPQRRAWSLHAWRLDAADVAASHEVLATIEGEFDPRLAVAHRQPWAALATTDGDRWFLRICPLQAGPAPAPIYEQHGDLKAIAVSPDDRRTAVGGDAVSDDEDAVDFRATVVDVESRQFQTLTRSHGARIDAAAFDAAGTLLATGDVDGHAQAWTLPAEWAAAAPPPNDPVFLRDGAGDMTGLACPRPGWTACCVGGRVALWDCAPGNPQFVELAAADSAATKVAATPDGRWLIVGHDDGTVRFWNLPRVILAFRAAAKAGIPLRGNAPADDEA